MIQKLVQIVQSLQLIVNRAMPVTQMKARRDILVDARQVSITEEFSDVGELIAESRQVDANFS